MQPRYFDDFKVGERFTTRGLTISESQILDFALLYDPQPFHIDRLAAQEGPFAGLIASGFQTLALTFRLFYDSGVIKHCSLGSPGFEELRWLAPVRPGDRLQVEAEVLEARPSSSKPDRGILRMAYLTRINDGTPVLSFKGTLILARRPQE